MKKIKFWSLIIMAAMILPLVSACGGDDGDSPQEAPPIDLTQEYINKLQGTWRLVSRTIDGERVDLTYYTQRLTFFQEGYYKYRLETFDYTLLKKPITPESAPTKTIVEQYAVYLDSDYNQYVIEFWSKLFSDLYEYVRSYYLLKFENNDTRLLRNEIRETRLICKDVWEKVTE